MQHLHNRATVARIWRGRVPSSRADEYQKYLCEAGIPPLERTSLAVEVLREDRGEETEFITISYWEDVEAMSRFAGSDARRIHHLDRDSEFLIEMPKCVQVLNIIQAPLSPLPQSDLSSDGGA